MKQVAIWGTVMALAALVAWAGYQFGRTADTAIAEALHRIESGIAQREKTHAAELAARAKELEAWQRAHAEEIAMREKAHSAELAARAKELEAWQKAHAEEIAMREKAHSDEITALAKDRDEAVAYGELRTQQLSLERTTTDVPPQALLFNLDAALDPITRAGLRSKREELIRFVWKDIDPSSIEPSAIREESARNIFAGIADGANVRMVETSFPNAPAGFTEVALGERRNCLAIWAQGHEGEPGDYGMLSGGTLFLREMWVRNCDLIVVPMPLRMEGDASVQIAGRGKVWIGPNHDGLSLLETEDFSAFRLFLDPLYGTLNWLNAEERYDRIVMAGVSGGGWMSVVYPAIDPRVTDAISVAGSFPMHLRMLETEGVMRDWGDWEQTYWPFYRIASYFDLYLLSAFGEGRRQTLVYNAWDPCCFAGARAMTFLPKLELKADALGIELSSIIDRTHHAHDLSEATLKILVGGLKPAL